MIQPGSSIFMLRSLMNLLTKAMPVLLLLFVILAACQLFLLLPVTGQKFSALYEGFIDFFRPFFLPIALLSLLFVLVGYGYEISSNKLARLGLRRRKGVLPWLLDRFTSRQKINDILARSYQDGKLDTGELAASLRARVIGQDLVCEDIAQQIKLRLATQKHHRPVGIFLFLGPAGTGKKFLAQQVARQLKRPFFILKPGENSETGHSLSTQLIHLIKQNPQAVLIIPNCRALSSQDWSQLSGMWTGQNGAPSPFQGALFIFTETTTDITSSTSQESTTAEERRMTGNKAAHAAQIQTELTNQCDRIFLFHPLKTKDLAHVSALLLENMIKDYGLNVEAGGLDPNLILPLIRQQQNHSLTAHEMIRLIEDQIGESLIALSQQSSVPGSTLAPAPVQLALEEHNGRQTLIVRRLSSTQERLTPVMVKG